MIVSGPVRKILTTLPVLALALGLTLVTLSADSSAQDGHAAEPAAGAHGDEAAHGGEHHSRAGDSTLFMELFGHLEPHAVTAVWIGGDKGFAIVDPHLKDEHGKPIKDSHGNDATHQTVDSLNEALVEEMGGGQGFLIYNINTSMWVASLVLLLCFIPIASKARRLTGGAPKGGLYGLMEALVQFVRDDMVYAVMGKKAGRRFVPLFLTQFFFVLFMNLMGLVPMGHIGGTATANLAVTGGLALTTLIWIHLSGIREHGFTKHWLNFLPHGLPWFVLPIIVPVEILGMLVKPAALTIRLFANLTAGHLIVLGLMGLVFFFDHSVIAVPIMGMTIAIYCLELFVCFVQAYIFTYLSIVFLGASVHPDH